MRTVASSTSEAPVSAMLTHLGRKQRVLKRDIAVADPIALTFQIHSG
jgi:hypothetical protein